MSGVRCNAQFAVAVQASFFSPSIFASFSAYCKPQCKKIGSLLQFALNQASAEINFIYFSLACQVEQVPVYLRVGLVPALHNSG
jgi:hypothetical protein